MSDDKQLERWKKLRAKGAIFFIVVYGLLWGVVMMAMMCAFQFAISKLLPGREIEYFFEPTNLAVYGGIFLIIGVIWAAINWTVNERKFKKSNQD